jgi:alpha-tubulin suppressor-like RCC1 family protein
MYALKSLKWLTAALAILTLTVAITLPEVDMSSAKSHPIVTAIAAGQYHNLALKSDGTIWAWGENNYGELGDAKGRQE